MPTTHFMECLEALELEPQELASFIDRLYKGASSSCREAAYLELLGCYHPDKARFEDKLVRTEMTSHSSIRLVYLGTDT